MWRQFSRWRYDRSFVSFACYSLSLSIKCLNLYSVERSAKLYLLCVVCSTCNQGCLFHREQNQFNQLHFSCQKQSRQTCWNKSTLALCFATSTVPAFGARNRTLDVQPKRVTSSTFQPQSYCVSANIVYSITRTLAGPVVEVRQADLQTS